ncbi:MAG: hypothetical protein ACI81L_002149 [Verrucomicrobiales bacterium]
MSTTSLSFGFVVCAAAFLSACGGSDPTAAIVSTTEVVSATAAPTTVVDIATTTATSTSAPATTSTASVEPSATLPSTVDVPGFASSISPITDEIAARLTHSWREGCPVGLEDLRLLTISHWNYDDRASTGELVVREDFAEEIVGVFHTLFQSRFPIERMEIVDAYQGDDDLSMSANNTSAFNCREVAWKPGVWSNHAFGTAIDINPLVNPYVSNTQVLPREGSAFSDRSVETLGGIYPGDAVTEAMANIGWIWGGTWSSAKDWQHFSAGGD